jgi:hypothetical protein
LVPLSNSQQYCCFQEVISFPIILSDNRPVGTVICIGYGYSVVFALESALAMNERPLDTQSAVIQ